MHGADERIERLGRDDVPDVVDVLFDAFRDYPAVRFFVGPDASGYEAKLRTILRFFAMARVLRAEPMLGIRDAEGLAGVALVSRPSGDRSSRELDALREAVWRELGSEARARYEAYGAACAPTLEDGPHLHLSMIGVRGRTRGSGLGRRLIDHVHQLSARDPASGGVTLNTEDEANVALYEHLGYVVTGQARVAPGLTTWGFFRRNA